MASEAFEGKLEPGARSLAHRNSRFSASHACRSIGPIMTAAEAYSEAQRRLQAAKTTGQHWLDLGDIEGLEQIPDEIVGRELAIKTRESGNGRVDEPPPFFTADLTLMF